MERLRGAFEHGLKENAALLQSKFDAMRMEYVEQITRECAAMKSNVMRFNGRRHHN